MSSSYEDFVEVLENDDEVDVAKLADMSQHGVPAEVRGLVWKYLLGAAHADKCELVDFRFIAIDCIVWYWVKLCSK